MTKIPFRQVKLGKPTFTDKMFHALPEALSKAHLPSKPILDDFSRLSNLSTF